MERHIQIFVKNELFRGETPPEKSNRSFYPKRSDISNHIYKATIKHRFSQIDQENLNHKIYEWKKKYPDDFFYFCEYGSYKENLVFDENATLVDRLKYGSDQRLLVIHQSKEQKRLLEHYGEHICLLDAIYKTTQYSIPLFFIVVKTNVDYQIVGSFATQDETTQTITEALGLLSNANKNWKPNVFFVHNCCEEIQALENVFPRKI